ncbi:helix-turn-helix domain-containing protein, partial [Mesorhizobium sp. M0684]|uniref:helix-turn-helix transcriptional regulator n=1 Tax=Mesorhizobium sp. M0684 TaxID=2956986 RepID=UPI00333A3EE9
GSCCAANYARRDDLKSAASLPGHAPARRPSPEAYAFASDERQPLFFRVIDRYERALELIAIFFHFHARRKLADARIVDGVALSRREIECLKWAARGKTAWEIGRILGISRRTAAYHRDNARKKLGAPTTIQAAVRLALSRPSDVS